MSNNKILTVTVPSYNVEKYLPEIIPTYLDKCILNDLEIIIVDDGSKDRTAEIAQKFVDNYPETIRLISKENAGHGSTINTGIQNASGTYFKVIDGDDWVDTNTFVRFIKILKKCSEDVILSSFNCVNVDSGIITKKAIYGLEEDKKYSLIDILPLLRDNYAMHGCTFRTDIMRKIKKIDEHCFYVDQECILYPLPYVRTAVYYDLPIYQYRVGNTEQSMSLKNMQRNRDMHCRVIYSLLKMLSDVEGNDEVKRFLQFKIEKMAQLQIDIYFSMDKSSEIWDELRSFLQSVKSMDEIVYRNIPGKKAQAIRMGGKFAYESICTLKRRKGS